MNEQAERRRPVKVFTMKTERSWTGGGGGETKAEGKEIICEPWIMPDLNFISQQHIEAEEGSCIQLAKSLASIWERGKKSCDFKAKNSFDSDDFLSGMIYIFY